MRISDWSSDVCSSDLSALRLIAPFTELNVHGAENPQITFQWEVDTDLSQIDKYETQLFVSALRPGKGLLPDDTWPDRRLLVGEEDPNLPAHLPTGRTTCRERARQNMYISWGAVTSKNKKNYKW